MIGDEFVSSSCLTKLSCFSSAVLDAVLVTSYLYFVARQATPAQPQLQRVSTTISFLNPSAPSLTITQHSPPLGHILVLIICFLTKPDGPAAHSETSGFLDSTYAALCVLLTP